MSSYRDVVSSVICFPAKRQRLEIATAGIEELARSIQSLGLLQPLVVKEVANGMEIIAGERRFRAVTMLGWSEVPCLVVDADEAMTALMMLTENLQRENLSPVEEAHGVEHRATVLGESVAQIAKALGKSEPWVRGRRDMLAWPAAALEAVQLGSLSMAAVRPLLDIEDAADRDRLLECAVQSGANAQVTASWAAAAQGVAAPALDGARPYRQTQAELAAYVVKMPCFWCRNEFPGLELRVLRMCGVCVEGAESARDAPEGSAAASLEAAAPAGGSTEVSRTPSSSPASKSESL